MKNVNSEVQSILENSNLTQEQIDIVLRVVTDPMNIVPESILCGMGGGDIDPMTMMRMSGDCDFDPMLVGMGIDTTDPINMMLMGQRPDIDPLLLMTLQSAQQRRYHSRKRERECITCGEMTMNTKYIPTKSEIMGGSIERFIGPLRDLISEFKNGDIEDCHIYALQNVGIESDRTLYVKVTRADKGDLEQWRRKSITYADYMNDQFKSRTISAEEFNTVSDGDTNINEKCQRICDDQKWNKPSTFFIYDTITGSVSRMYLNGESNEEV